MSVTGQNRAPRADAVAPSSESKGLPRKKGVLYTWNDERGFGYLRTADAGEPVFVHIKSFSRRPRRPRIGDTLIFSEGVGRNALPAAEQVEIEGEVVAETPRAKLPRRVPIADVTRLLAAVSIFIAVATLSALGRAPLWFGMLYYVMGLASLMLYSADKRYAIAGQSRVRETSMHISDALFGIGGGLFAQHVFRHKIRKRSFRYITRLIYILHATLLMALLAGLIRFDTLMNGAG